MAMVSDKMYKRMQLGCICGHVSRNMGEEARHRHNFPAFCKRPAPTCVAFTNKVDGKTGTYIPCKRKTQHASGLCFDHRRNPHVPKDGNGTDDQPLGLIGQLVNG